jgi:hypothetical protein
MRDWALEQTIDPAKPVILIAGHTHQPVFDLPTRAVSGAISLRAGRSALR